MEKLTWFKFTPSDWVMGKIQRCPEITQARFMRLCCVYWNKDCVLTFEEADIEVDKEHIELLVSKKIIKIENNYIVIDFLKEQLDEIIVTSEKRRKAVQKRWDNISKKNTSVSKNNTNELINNTSVIQNDTDKSKSREDKEKNILNKSLLSEIKISEDKNFLLINDLKIKTSEDYLKYFSIAIQFQKLFIKNLKEKNSPTFSQEKAKYADYVTPIRLIFEKDKANKEQLIEAYNYLNSSEGEFWKSNILNTAKLREKLSTLIAKKNTKSNFEAKKEALVPDHSKRTRF
jgi:hypothetical protein